VYVLILLAPALCWVAAWYLFTHPDPAHAVGDYVGATVWALAGLVIIVGVVLRGFRRK
jgi:hypothetical protein